MDKIGQEEPSLSAQAVQTQIYWTMGAARKLRAVFEMFEFALRLARSGTRMRHPDWTNKQVEAEARRLVTGTTLYRRTGDAGEIT